MTAKDNSSHRPSLAGFVYRFLGGTALGGMLLFIPLSVSSIHLNPLQVVLACTLVMLCGVLSGTLGTKFAASMLKSFESSGFY